MANPVLGKSLCSDWFFLGQDFAVRTISMETCEHCHSSHWSYQKKLKRLKFFQNFKDGWRRRSFFKCKSPEVHFTIRNRVPYNKLLTNRACLGHTGEYWPLVIFVQTSLRSVRTVTTSGQYSPVRPSHSVSKRLILLNINCLVAKSHNYTCILKEACIRFFFGLDYSARFTIKIAWRRQASMFLQLQHLFYVLP